ncbi:glycoside hydrolase/deacetylase, partial [Rhizoclosmatium globosum]
GPSQYTPDLLATLAKYGIKATFFVIGSQAILYPDILLAIHQAGHQIGSHTWSHSDMTTLSHDQIVAELVTTAMAIKQITGVTPKFWRPPYGYVNREMLAVASSLGLTSIKWLRDTGDFNLQSGTTTTDAVLSNVQSWVTAGQRNAISLQHDMYAASESIAGPVVQILMNAGVNVVRMDQCVQSDAYGGPLDKFVSAMFH